MCVTLALHTANLSAAHQGFEPLGSSPAHPLAQPPATPSPVLDAQLKSPLTVHHNLCKRQHDQQQLRQQQHLLEHQHHQRVNPPCSAAPLSRAGTSITCVGVQAHGATPFLLTKPWLQADLSNSFSCLIHRNACLSTSALSASTSAKPTPASSSPTSTAAATSQTTPLPHTPVAAAVTETAPAGQAESVLTNTEQPNSTTSTYAAVKAKAPRNSTRHASLTRHPPGSVRWEAWASELCLIPGMAPEHATALLHKNPMLLETSPEDAAYRINDMFNLLARETGLPQPALVLLLRQHPLMAALQVREVSAVLVWLGIVLGCKEHEKGRLVQKAPQLLSFGAQVLEQRLEVLLALGIGRERASECIIRAPVLLLLPSERVTESVEGLVREFGCSEAYILQQVPYVLTRSLSRLRPRAAFLRFLGVKQVSIHNTSSGDPDEVFAEQAVRAYTKRSGKTLADLCLQIQKTPGFTKAVAAAKMSMEVATPMQCVQAHRCMWEAGEVAAEIAAVASLKARKKKAAAAPPDEYFF